MNPPKKNQNYNNTKKLKLNLRKTNNITNKSNNTNINNIKSNNNKSTNNNNNKTDNIKNNNNINNNKNIIIDNDSINKVNNTEQNKNNRKDINIKKINLRMNNNKTNNIDIINNNIINNKTIITKKKDNNTDDYNKINNKTINNNTINTKNIFIIIDNNKTINNKTISIKNKNNITDANKNTKNFNKVIDINIDKKDNLAHKTINNNKTININKRANNNIKNINNKTIIISKNMNNKTDTADKNVIDKNDNKVDNTDKNNINNNTNKNKSIAVKKISNKKINIKKKSSKKEVIEVISIKSSDSLKQKVKENVETENVIKTKTKFELKDEEEKFDEINIKDTQKLDNYELYHLEFSEAIILDKRDFLTTYLALLKREQLIMFTFLSWNDYNLFYVKIDRFIFLLVIAIAMNSLFFADKTIHKLYLDEGKYNFGQSIPQIIYSLLIAHAIEILLCFLTMTDKHIYEIKGIKKTKDASERIFQIIKLMRIKLIVFFVFTSILFIFYWYCVSAFCAVYQKTQGFLILNSFFSFLIFLIDPFIIYGIIVLLRKLALNYSGKKVMIWIYNISKFFPIF